MTLQLIAGRAGTGKTEHCLTAVIRELDRAMTEGPALLVITPEQATLQTERQLLSRTRLKMHALGRCDVLSFSKLARRIFAGTPSAIPTTLSTTGRQMAIRYLLGRHRNEFKEFGNIAERGSFVREAAGAMAEFFREAVSFDRLDAYVQDAFDNKDPSAGRLHDLALLYRAYCEYLGDDRVDPDGVLALAKDRLATADWLRGARVWVDGFASFTRQQAQLLIELARYASSTDVAMLLDPNIGELSNFPNDINESDLFYKTRRAWAELTRAAIEVGVAIETPLLLTPKSPPRFTTSPRLARLESEALSRSTKIPAAATDAEDRADIRLVEASDLRTEARGVARTILDLTRRADAPLRLRDIAVIVRDLEPYHDLLSAEFKRHGIPFFLDRRRPIHHHPLIELVRALLALIGGGGIEDAISRMLKTGLTPLDDVSSDALENYLLARNVADATAWDQRWTGKPPGFRSSQSHTAKKQTEVINAARAKLRAAMRDWWPGQLGEMTGNAWATALVQALDHLRVTDTLAAWSQAAQDAGHHDAANEHERVWTELMQLLEEFVDALGDVPLSARRNRETMEAGLTELTLGLVPATLDQVVISTIERGRQPLGIKATFILGFADGLWSGRAQQEGLLGDDERDRLEAFNAPVGRSRRERLAEERILTYVALTRATEFLWISRPTRDDKGREMEAALHWPDVERTLAGTPLTVLTRDGAMATANDVASRIAEAAGQSSRGMPVITNEDALPWHAYYDWVRQHKDSPSAKASGGATRLADPLSRALQSIHSSTNEQGARLDKKYVERLWPAPHHSSITRLEQFARCPFQHFARYGLTLLPRETRELSQIHWGNFYHKALEQFANDLLESGERLDEVDDVQLARRVGDLCTRVLPSFIEQQQLDEAQGIILRRRGGPYLERFLRWQRHLLGAAHFAPNKAEVGFGKGADTKWPALSIATPNGRTIQVDGKIDRLDLTAVADDQWAIVFDYKTSASGRRLRLDEVYHGMALQLLAYLLAVKDHLGAAGGGVRLGGAFLTTILTDATKVDHPRAADDDGFDPYKGYQPRGIVDFGAIPELDKHANGNTSSIFQVKQKSKVNEISNFNASDAVEPGMLDEILGFVRSKLGQLADQWLDGDISVLPLRHGKRLPCDYCDYRSVCRFEYRPDQMRFAETLKRLDAIEAMRKASDRSSEAQS